MLIGASMQLCFQEFTVSFSLLQILQLQKQLQDQLVVRHALEKASGYQQLSYDATIDDSLPKVSPEVFPLLLRKISTISNTQFLNCYSDM